jgi:ketosteroid isomerase-like protein
MGSVQPAEVRPSWRTTTGEEPPRPATRRPLDALVNGNGTRQVGHDDASESSTDGPAVAAFLARFARFGAAPSVATYLPLFHPDVQLFDDGMERPIGYDEIPASITATLGLAQEFCMVPERWRARDGVVLVEARNAATILGTPCQWQSVYRVRLDGDRVIDGRRYYDRAPLLATFDATSPRLPSLASRTNDDVVRVDHAAPSPLACTERGPTTHELVELCAEAWRAGSWGALLATFRDDATWHAPGVDGALGRDAMLGFRTCFARLLCGVVPVIRAWAGNDTLLLVEWHADVPTPTGATYAFGMVERFDLVAGRVLAARSYFDASSLARALTPAA